MLKLKWLSLAKLPVYSIGFWLVRGPCMTGPMANTGGSFLVGWVAPCRGSRENEKSCLEATFFFSDILSIVWVAEALSVARNSLFLGMR